MTIDFHSRDVQGAYASRAASGGWTDAMRDIMDPREKTVADIGCGGGIYSRAWHELGANRVIGIDFSFRMVADAITGSAAYPNISFCQGDAASTGLQDTSVDIVFERALIHHLPDPDTIFSEAFRILKPGGMIIVQDRTLDDVLRPASPEHLRGYFFEEFPQLLHTERARRPDTSCIMATLRNAGFADVTTQSLPEVRRIYESPQELEVDLYARSGRSILHELSNAELNRLIARILKQVTGAFPLRETDYWTIWTARRPE